MTLVLALDRYGADLAIEQDALAAAGATVVAASDDPARRARELGAAVGLLVVDHPVDASLLRAAPSCRVVATYGIGYDNIDLTAARERGIVVANVPGYCVDEVADHTVALWLACERAIVRGDAMVRRGEWSGSSLGPMRRLRGLTFGVVGFGRIGRAVAERVQGFGLSIVGYDPAVLASDGAMPFHLVPDLPSLLDRSDVVSVHVPLTDDTRGLLDADAIGAMKPGGVLINASRGGVVDQDALLEAVATRRLAGAGLDVYTEEPPGSMFTSRVPDRVVLSPHVAFLSTEALLAARRGAAEAIARVLRGEPVASRVA